MAITIDATSGYGIMQDAAEWDELLLGVGDSRGGPSSIVLAQDALGNPVDSGPAGRTIAVVGTGLSYQEAVVGWTSLGLKFAEGGSNRLDIAVPGMGGSSTAVFAYVLFETQSALRTFIESANMLVRVKTGDVLQINAASNEDGSVEVVGFVLPVIFQSDITNERARVVDKFETISADFGLYGSPSGTDTLTIGGTGAGGSSTAGMTLLYMAIFDGVPAERSEAEWNAILEAAGWAVGYTPPPWNLVEYEVASTQPVEIESLLGMPDGSVVGNTVAYTGFFRNLDWQGAFGNGPSQPVLVPVGSIVYPIGYPNGLLLRWDPAQPWTYDGSDEANPAALGSFGAGTMKYCGFAAFSPSLNWLIAFGRRERDEDGCGIGVYDIGTATFTHTTQDHLTDYRAPRGFVLLDGVDKVVASADPHPAAGLSEAQLLVYSRDLTFVAAYTVQPGMTALGKLYSTPVPGVILGVADYAVYLFNVLTGTLIDYQAVPAGLGATTQDADGVVWAQRGAAELVTISGTSLDIDVRGDLTPVGGDIKAMSWSGPTLFLAYGTQVFQATGVIAALAGGTWWGGWFPKVELGAASWWGGGANGSWFPEGVRTTIPPSSPGGAASFMLTLDSEVQITQRWMTGLSKSYDGTEKRSSSLSDPALIISGSAILVGDQVRDIRARLARFAATGAPVWLGFSHEDATVRADSSGYVIPLFNTGLLDWAVVGCPVFIVHNFYGGMQATIQSITGTSITIDKIAGDIGSKGARVIPAVAIFLDPRQGFDRVPHARPDEASDRAPVEVWKISGRMVNPGFMSSPIPAGLELEAPTTQSGVLDGLRIVARIGGAAGNDIVITQTDDALTDAGEFEEDPIAGTVAIRYSGETTTVADYIALFGSMTLVRIEGTPASTTDVLASGDDEFTENLAGGLDPDIAEVGRGATITEYRGRPVWDRGVHVPSSIIDSLQAKATTKDLGGLPFVIGVIPRPDWGRGISVTGELAEPFQWFKRFTDTVKGSFRGFWLSTSRQDLIPVSTGTGTITLRVGSDADGAFFTWYPTLRRNLEIIQADDTITRVRITSALDNGDETVTLDIVDEDDDPVTLSGVDVEAVSWLELVRLEGDEVNTSIRGALFFSKFDARAIHDYESVAVPSDLFVQDAGSVDSSEPREGIELILSNNRRWFISTSTRAETFNGIVFPAMPGARGEIKVMPMGGNSTDTDSCDVHIPMAHPVAQRWMAGLVPPRRLSINVWRKQLRSGAEETVWRGEAVSMSPQGEVAIFTVPSSLARALRRRLPTLTAGRSCPHILGDANCKKDIEAMRIVTTITGINGRDVTVASIGGQANSWATGGRLRHTASGESMTIFNQVGTAIEMQLPLFELRVGDTVDVLPGCDKLITTCGSKFANVRNFGNPPQLPLTNPMRTTGFGIISS